MNFLKGYKTYLAAAGMFGLALHDFSVGQYHTAIVNALAGLAMIGVRSAITDLVSKIADAVK